MKTYIGDSVYAEIADGRLTLTTENGYGPSNTIILEPETWVDLKFWVEAMTTRLSHVPSDNGAKSDES